MNTRQTRFLLTALLLTLTIALSLTGVAASALAERRVTPTPSPTLDPNSTPEVSPLPIAINRIDTTLDEHEDANLVAEGTSIGDRFFFRLVQQPTADVSVTFSTTDPAQLLLLNVLHRGGYTYTESYTVIFSAAGLTDTATIPWDAEIALNPYGVPDADVEAPTIYGIHFAFSSDDPAYDNLVVPDEPVTVFDAGVTLDPESLTLEKGKSGEYTVVLDAPPGLLALRTGQQSEQVTVTLSGFDPLLTVSPTVLTFDRSNWNVPQTVTVTAAEGGSGGDQTATIDHGVTSDVTQNPYMDSPYGGPDTPAPNITAPSLPVTITSGG